MLTARVLEKVNEDAVHWIAAMMAEMGTDDARLALQALRAGLRAVRDCLTVHDAAQISARMPVVVRGLFFEGWEPAASGPRPPSAAAILERIHDGFAPRTGATPEEIFTALARVLLTHLRTDDHRRVLLSLPSELVRLVIVQ